MKSDKFDQLPNCDERLVVAVPTEVKARLFRVATERGLPASVLIRQALAAVMDEPRAA
nr:hypothetical protein [uncultured Devosia sp.]